MKKRVLSGMRPTGKLHLGHLLGAIDNWLKLQANPEYQCFFFIADWHALSTAYQNTGNFKTFIREMIIDYLAAGLSPEKVTFYVQSDIPEIAELTMLFNMITPTSWVTRVPSYKGQIQELGEEIDTLGFLGYPVLMTCDIIAFKADLVPVGQDQLAHLELCRELLRRFHFLYQTEIFPEPQALLTQTPMVPGTDARKMSKSYNNALFLSDSPAELRDKIKKMFTDPQKIYKGDPGHPDSCPVFFFQQLYNPEAENLKADCIKGSWGCVPCKQVFADSILKVLEPLQIKRRELEGKYDLLEEILSSGAKKAREEAGKTLKQAKEAMKIR